VEPCGRSYAYRNHARRGSRVTRLSIVIVSFNTRVDLLACLQSLTLSPPMLDREILVVDNGSSDGSADAARTIPDVQTVVLDRNMGFAVANNVGIRASRGDLVLLLNSDTVVPAGALDRLVARLEAIPEAAVAGPRLVDPNGRVELSFGSMISPFNELRQRVIGTLYQRHWKSVERWAERQTRREQFVDWVSGACLLVRRADAEAVGLLDERFFMYTEDVDFCHAIRSRGRRVLFTPAAEVVHSRGRSRAAAPDTARNAYRRSQIAFYDKHHPRWASLLRLYLKMKGDSPAGASRV
jgi:GT2 family glycosyltransferase